MSTWPFELCLSQYRQSQLTQHSRLYHTLFQLDPFFLRRRRTTRRMRTLRCRSGQRGPRDCFLRTSVFSAPIVVMLHFKLTNSASHFTIFAFKAMFYFCKPSLQPTASSSCFLCPFSTGFMIVSCPSTSAVRFCCPRILALTLFISSFAVEAALVNSSIFCTSFPVFASVSRFSSFHSSRVGVGVLASVL